MEKVLADYKKYLSDFLKFKSISTDPLCIKDCENTALWLQKLFISNGFNTHIWKSKSANPVVFAEYSLSRSADHTPTTLIYGHYDVQPASISDGWKNDPFSLSEDNTRFYGRGVIDNKGQVLVHIAAILELKRTKKLASNVKFMIEGNEETGNDSLSKLMTLHKEVLSCDYVLVSDGELTNNRPSIEVSLRGGFNCTLFYKTGKTNLHSGVWGGTVPNAAEELCKFLSRMSKPSGSMAFSDFYKGIDKASQSEIINNRSLMNQTKDLLKLSKVKMMMIPKNVDFYTATGLMPTIQITGFKSGYIDTGYSNIVPCEAEVRLNVRTAPSQKSKVIMKALENFVKKNTPNYIDYKLEFNNPHEPVKISTENKYLKSIESTLEKVYGEKVNRRNVGGAIPFVADVKAILGVDPVLVPLVNEDCNMHGANENFNKKYLSKALKFSWELFSS